MPEDPSCAVLVMSCDAYRDLWMPFFTLFWRYWPDCPFPVYLGTNTRTYDDARVVTLTAGEHTWSKELRLNLERINTSYVLLLLEDYFLNDRVETDRILHHLKLIETLSGTVLRLYPLPGPDVALAGNDEIGVIHRLADYRISTQAALWNRAELSAVLRDDESIWEFEQQGTARSQAKHDGFYSTFDPVLHYRQVVERGEWFRWAARFYERQEIGCDFNARHVMSPVTAVKKAINRRRRNWVGALTRRQALRRR
jgi:hypothetical protein